MGGSRNNTFDRFQLALCEHRADLVLLLIDAEDSS